MREHFYTAKWRRHHPQAFARFEEIMANRIEDGEVAREERMRELQELAKQRIVRHAMENTVFYKRFYEDAGFRVEDIGSEGWFERLPVVTKKELREHFDEFVDPRQKQFLKISTTGGSTGTPTKTGYDGRICEEVYSWRLQARYGVHPWDDHAYVWRDTRKSFKAKLINALQWWPTRHLKLDATFLTDEAIAAFIEKCAAVKPTLLQGYVGAITHVATVVSRSDKLKAVIKHWHPKVVWTTSAPLSAVQRKLIETTFGAPVCNEYGSCECRWIASQGPDIDGLYVNQEHVYLEYVDDNNKPVPMGEYGRALITNLEDTVFPLIRYENNDRGRYLKPGIIDSVKGRESESFVLPSGKIVNGEYLTTIFDATPDLVSGFRCVQHKDASITIEYVPRGAECDIIKVLEAFKASLGGEVPVEFRKVDSIPHDRGKLRFIVREK